MKTGSGPDLTHFAHLLSVQKQKSANLFYTVEYYKAIENSDIGLYLLTWKDIHSKLLREKIMYNITIYVACMYTYKAACII